MLKKLCDSHFSFTLKYLINLENLNLKISFIVYKKCDVTR